IVFLVPLLSMRWESLVRDLPHYMQKVKEIAQNLEGRFEPAYATEEWRWLFSHLVGSIDDLLSRIGSGMYAAVAKVVFNLLNLILAPILVFFMLYYKQAVIAGTIAW